MVGADISSLKPPGCELHFTDEGVETQTESHPKPVLPPRAPGKQDGRRHHSLHVLVSEDPLLSLPVSCLSSLLRAQSTCCTCSTLHFLEPLQSATLTVCHLEEQAGGRHELPPNIHSCLFSNRTPSLLGWPYTGNH